MSKQRLLNIMVDTVYTKKREGSATTKALEDYKGQFAVRLPHPA
jgi:hypothetical protein